MNESDRKEVLAFQQRAAKLQRAVMGAVNVHDDALTRTKYIRRALDRVAGPDPQLLQKVNTLTTELLDIGELLNGNGTIQSRSEPAPPSLTDRMGVAVGGLGSTSPPTGTHRQALAIAEGDFAPLLERLRRAVADLAAIEKQLDAAGAPWTPGRFPEWRPN